VRNLRELTTEEAEKLKDNWEDADYVFEGGFRAKNWRIDDKNRVYGNDAKHLNKENEHWVYYGDLETR
jgi:hypothetical protein